MPSEVAVSGEGTSSTSKRSEQGTIPRLERTPIKSVSKGASPTNLTSRSKPQVSTRWPEQGFRAYAGSGGNAFGSTTSPVQSISTNVRPVSERSSARSTWGFSDVRLEKQMSSASGANKDFSEASPSSLATLEQSSATPSPKLPPLPLHGRKRTRESVGKASALEHTAKTMRAVSQTTPPPSERPLSRNSSDFGSDIPSDLIALLGGDPREDMRKMAETQRELDQRREREKLDEEYARQLQEEFNAEFDSFNPRVSSTEGRTALNGGTYQAYIGSNGRLSRNEPIFAESATQATNFSSRNAGYAALTPPDTSRLSYAPRVNMTSSVNSRSFLDRNANSIAPVEPTAQSSSAPSVRKQSAYIDLASDSDSDAELSFIHPSKFVPRSRPKGSKPPALLDLGGPDHSDSRTIPSADLTALQSWPTRNHAPILRKPTSNAELNPTNAYSNYHSSSSSFPSLGLTNAISSTASNAYNALGNRILPWMQQSPGPLPGDRSLRPGYDRTVPFGDGSPMNPLSLDPLNSAFRGQDDEYYRSPADYAKTAEELRSLMNNIRPDDELGASDRTGSPEDMAEGCALYEHQKLGLAWMMKMEEGTNGGGILADDMGLGKTIQAIALMVSTRQEDKNLKTTLIVAPVALMKQWENEIMIKVRAERRLSTYIYHGSKKNITWDKLKTHDVVLTTYGTLASELARKERIEIKKKANPNWMPMTVADHLPLLGDRCKFYRVILDEAQNIKNKTTKSALATYALHATKRFCMTGTPMMNNVGELYSLICFLRIKPYCEWEKFNYDFVRPLKSERFGSTGNAMRKLQALLKAILLRRTKKSKINGQPILTLPERTTVVDHAVFDEEQEAFYTSLEHKTQLQFNRYIRAGSVGKNYANALVLLLRLRQACCHPHLIRDFEEHSPAELTGDELEKVARDLLKPETVRRLKEDGVSDCPICMDVMENSTIFTPCGHSTCSECFVRISDPSMAVEDNTDNNNRGFRCMTCRGNVNPREVTDWRSFEKIHLSTSQMNRGQESSAVNTESDGDSESESSDSDSESESELEDRTLDGFIVDDNATDDSIDDEEGQEVASGRGSNAEVPEKMRSTKAVVSKLTKSKKSKKSKKGKGKQKEKPEKREKKLSELQRESRRSAKARKKYLTRLQEDWVTSCKVEKCLEVLEEVLLREDNEKTIIFSQFTTMLDLLEVPINQKGWSYKRYDGSMSAMARNDAVLEFTSRRKCRIMLVSLKAGNSGLNLTAANNVILFDPFWNPYIEEQAIDRAHRIGQRKSVQVHRLLVKNTVEDRIIALQEKKRAMIEGALDETAGQNIARLGVRELAFLFGVSGS